MLPLDNDKPALVVVVPLSQPSAVASSRSGTRLRTIASACDMAKLLRCDIHKDWSSSVREEKVTTAGAVAFEPESDSGAPQLGRAHVSLKQCNSVEEPSEAPSGRRPSLQPVRLCTLSGTNSVADANSNSALVPRSWKNRSRHWCCPFAFLHKDIAISYKILNY